MSKETEIQRVTEAFETLSDLGITWAVINFGKKVQLTKITLTELAAITRECSLIIRAEFVPDDPNEEMVDIEVTP